MKAFIEFQISKSKSVSLYTGLYISIFRLRQNIHAYGMWTVNSCSYVYNYCQQGRLSRERERQRERWNINTQYTIVFSITSASITLSWKASLLTIIVYVRTRVYGAHPHMHICFLTFTISKCKIQYTRIPGESKVLY